MLQLMHVVVSETTKTSSNFVLAFQRDPIKANRLAHSFPTRQPVADRMRTEGRQL